MALDIKKFGISTEKGRRKITRQENAKFGPLTVDQDVDRLRNRSIGSLGLGI